MPLHPDIEAYFLRAASELPAPPQELTVDGARALHRLVASRLGPGRQIGRVADFPVAGAGAAIPCRIYYPPGAGPFPLLIFIHGGGWFGGDLDTHDVLCREIAHGTPCAVVAVDYRLAPEHKFPAGLEDCIAVIEHCLTHGEALGVDARIAVGGDSAGGNLAAAAVQQLTRPGNRAIIFQLLIYPATDLRMARISLRALEATPGLSARDVAWCADHYLNGLQDALDPRCSPLLAGNLEGLPPAFVVTAEFDILRDDGEAYALALAQAGVPVQLRRYLGMVHSFLSLPPDIPPTKSALADVCAALAATFAQN